MTATIRAKIERSKGMKEAQLKTLNDKIEEEEKLSDILKVQEELSVLIQQTAKETQEQLQFHIIDIVQSALDSVFPNKYTFKIEFELKRGRTEASIFLDKDGERINPMDSSGGGVVDIVAFALRVACWSLGTSRNTILMDEPFKFLSANLKPLSGEIIKGISRKLNIQIITVTHDQEMISVSDMIVKVEQKDGVSKATTTIKEEE